MAKEFILFQGGGAFLLSTDEVSEEFKEVPKEPVRYVVVADAYKNFTYENLNLAFRYLLEGADLIAIAPNRYFMDKDYRLSLDAGPFVKALEYASGKEAKIIGKPSKDFFHVVLKALGVEPYQALMVGDDIEFDIKGAQEAGIKGVLVKTGKFRQEDLKKGIEPFALLESVAELPEFLS
ncbi:MAG: HAD-IA family hydrolase [Aquificaceae bacterium]